MRILFLALDVKLEVYRGDSTHTMNLALALQERGNDVTLVVAEGQRRGEVTLPGVDVHALETSRDPLTTKRCVEIGKLAKAEVIYERRYSPKISYAVSRRMRKPYLVEVNGIIEDDIRAQGGMPMRGGVVGRLKSLARGHFYRKAAAVIAVSPGIRAHLIEAYGLKDSHVQVVSNGVDAELFAPSDPLASRKANDLPEDSKIVCFVGNLVSWQGLESLVAASPSILDSHPDVLFVVVGDGLQRERITDMASELGVYNAFFMPGSVPYDTVPSWISAADMCVAPFTWERNVREFVSSSKGRQYMATMSPLKVFEYMACGRPVVITDMPGVADIVRDAGAGVVVPPDEPRALSEAIASLLERRAEREAMGLRGRRAVLECYTWDHTVENVERFLSEAVS